MKYRLSHINSPDHFCSLITTTRGDLYLLNDGDKDLKELASDYYEVLRALMDYESLLIAIEKNK